MNAYIALANTVFVFHIAWLIWLVGGGLATWWLPWIRPYYLVTAMTTLFSLLLFRGCPLTFLEDSIRKLDNPDVVGYKSSFICYFMKKFFGIQLSPVAITVTMAIIAATSYTLCFGWF